MVIAENLLLTMGDEEGMWGKPSLFFIGDKPIDTSQLNQVELEIFGAARGGGKSRIQREVLMSELETHVSEFTCEVKQTDIESVAETMAQNMVDEAVDNAKFKANDFDHSITMEVTISPKQMWNLRKMLRQPKLPRKLKKYVKKTCLSEPPKRVPRMVLNYAFAVNHPHRARRVGLRVERQTNNE